MRNYRLLAVASDSHRAQTLRQNFTKAEPPITMEIVGNLELCSKALADDLHDALVIDCETEKRNVFEFVQKLRASGLEMPILLLAPSPRNEKAGEAFATDGETFIKIENSELDALPRLVRFSIERRELKTQLAAFERRLVQNEKLAMIGLLAGGIAHELRNPLNTIDAVRYYLADLPSLQESVVQEKLEAIHKHVRRASAIISNVLEFSKPSKHRREAINLDAVVDSTLALFGKEFSVKNIEIAKRYEKMPLVNFNLDALKQVFFNLLMNATQAMPNGGALTISARTSDENIEVAIADTGAGISPENRQRLFSPFFTMKAEKEGTGLGLYISKLIIEREGGKIAVESEVGTGSVFSVLLPMVEQRD